MKLYAISDTHNDTKWLDEIPEDVDFVLHSGDITDLGSEYEVETIIMAMYRTGKRFLLCPGNHDFALEYDTDFVRRINDVYGKLVTVVNKPKTVKMTAKDGSSINVFCNPYVIEYGSWAFGREEEEMAKYLPESKVDIILAHCPPSHPKISLCYLSKHNYIDIGNKALTNFLNKSEDNIIVICGHNHMDSFVHEEIGKAVVCNVATNGIIISI